MSYTDEEVKKIYDTLTEESEAWHEIAANWKRSAEAALKVLEGLEWAPHFTAAGVLWKCPTCYTWKPDPHEDDCALWAALTTGRRRRPEVPSGSEPAERDGWPPGANVGPRVPKRPTATHGLEKEFAKEGKCQRSWSSYDELLTAYLKLARERVLVNVLCIVSSLVAFIVLAVQVARALGRG